MEEFIAGLPKAELHLHLEGTLTIARMLELASKNKVDVPSLSQIEYNRTHYQHFGDFQDQYDANIGVIKTMEDLYFVTLDYLKICAEQNILYTEIQFCSIPYTKLGFSFDEVFNALNSASEEAFRTLGVRSNFILCIVKHFNHDDSMQDVHNCSKYKDRIVAIGCAGPEIGYPASKISHLYDEARKLGFKHYTAHSGEFGDPSCMIETLYHLKVTRIDHGVRCLEDKFLIKFLQDSEIWLTVCPLSNHYLNVLDSYFDGEHIVERLLENRIKITINSDDPTLLGGYLNENYLTVSKSFKNKSEEEVKIILAQLAKNSFLASFVEDDIKFSYIRRLDEYLAKHGITLN